MQNLANFDAVLKEFYEGAIRETLNNDVPLFRILDASDKAWSGRRVLFPVHTARNSGVGARSEGATLPTAGNQSHEGSVISATYQYGRGQVSGQVVAAGKNAFAEALAVELDGLMTDLTQDVGRQTWGTGDGRLAQVGADGASSTAILVFNRFAEPGQPGGRYIATNQVLDLGDNADPNSDASAVTVISVALSSNPATTTDTVTISDSTVTVSQSDTFLYNVNAGGTGLEINGIRALVDVFTESNAWGSNAYASATIQGINRSTVSQWNASILGNSQTERILDGNLMQVAFDKINTESGRDPSLIMAEHSVVRAFLDHVSADRRYSGGASGGDFGAGMASLSYNGVQLERDRLAPFNECLVMVKEAIKHYTLLPLEFADDDGSILSRQTNTDEWQFFVRTYLQQGLDMSPKMTLMIRDIRTDL